MEKRQLASKKRYLKWNMDFLITNSLVACSDTVQNRQTRSHRDAIWGLSYICTADCAGLLNPTWTNPVLLWLLTQMKRHVCVKASLKMLSLRPVGNRLAHVMLGYVHFCNAAGPRSRWLCMFWCRTREPIGECDSESVQHTHRQDQPTWFLCSGKKKREKTIRKLEYREKNGRLCAVHSGVCQWLHTYWFFYCLDLD